MSSHSSSYPLRMMSGVEVYVGVDDGVLVMVGWKVFVDEGLGVLVGAWVCVAVTEGVVEGDLVSEGSMVFVDLERGVFVGDGL